MVLSNIKNTRKESGFTIVELLIVIVVIAILATISIVAYSGIQNRAKDTKAEANASQVQKVAEAYFADFSVYPSAVSQFSATTAAAKLPTSVTLLTAAAAGTIPAVPAALSGTNGDSSVMYRYVGAVGAATGACAFFWDYVPASGNAAISSAILMGNATTSNCTSATAASGNSLVTGS